MSKNLISLVAFGSERKISEKEQGSRCDQKNCGDEKTRVVRWYPKEKNGTEEGRRDVRR